MSFLHVSLSFSYQFFEVAPCQCLERQLQSVYNLQLLVNNDNTYHEQ